MGRVRLVAGASQKYGGRRIRIGESFYATAEHAKDLIAIGFASPDAIQDDPVPEVATEEPRKKRKYKRRDMEAET